MTALIDMQKKASQALMRCFVYAPLDCPPEMRRRAISLARPL